MEKILQQYQIALNGLLEKLKKATIEFNEGLLELHIGLQAEMDEHHRYWREGPRKPEGLKPEGLTVDKMKEQSDAKAEI
jgi:hypothetical protein